MTRLQGKLGLAAALTVIVTCLTLPALGQANQDDETALLEKQLLSDNAWVRANAASKLAKAGKIDLALPVLMECLGDRDVRGRRGAAEGLAAIGAAAEPAIPDLAKCLNDEDAGVRMSAALALAKLGQADAVLPALGVLVSSLEDPDPQVRGKAAECLGAIGPKAARACAGLAQALADTDAGVRASAVRALAAIGTHAEPAVLPLCQCLSDVDVTVRQAAAGALSRIGRGASPAVPALTKALSDPDGWVQWVAAEALGNIGEDAAAAIPELVKLLSDPGLYERTFAARALLRLGEVQSALPVLVAALDTTDDWARISAEDTLVGMGGAWPGVGASGAPAASQIARLLGHTNPSVRWSAARVLCEIGPGATPATAALLNALGDQLAGVRVNVAGALAQVGRGDVALPVLIACLDDPDSNVRSMSASALARLGPAAAPAADVLVKHLQESNAGIRVQVARALGRIGRMEEAIPVLTMCLGDEQPWVRANAIGALADVATEAEKTQVTEAATKALADADVNVQWAARQALAKIEGR